MTPRTPVDPLSLCARCGHDPYWHRLDDALNISPADPDAPFRCAGPGLKDCADDCPDYMEYPDEAVSV